MRVNKLDGMNKIWSYQAKRYDMQGSDMEAGYQVGGCHADGVGGVGGAGQHVLHLRRGLLPLWSGQDQGPVCCSSFQADGDRATAILDVLLVRQVQRGGVLLLLLLLARGVWCTPFPSWGLGGLLRRRR